MQYIIRVECSDCTGIDYQGCFSGKPGYVIADSDCEAGYKADEVGVEKATRFPTRDRAEEALTAMEMETYWPGGPWSGEAIPAPTEDGEGLP